MSDQIIKKMDKSDNKKKSAMSEEDMENLYLTRVGSLAATAHLHEANELISTYSNIQIRSLLLPS